MAETREGADVIPIPPGDDASLVRALKGRHPGAAKALYDRYAPYVQQVLATVLGPDEELPEVLHEVFVRAFGKVDSIRDGRLLKSWITTVAVYTARGVIRRRTRKHWLTFLAPEELPDTSSTAETTEVGAALRCVYEVLDRLPADERIAFPLRYIEGFELTEVAKACGVSLATIKRRLSASRERFTSLAQGQSLLKEWLEQGRNRSAK